jgi:hypothetical protein
MDEARCHPHRDDGLLWFIGGFLYQRSIDASIWKQAAEGIVEAQVPPLSFRAFLVVWGAFLVVVDVAIAIWLRRHKVSRAAT